MSLDIFMEAFAPVSRLGPSFCSAVHRLLSKGSVDDCSWHGEGVSPQNPVRVDWRSVADSPEGTQRWIESARLLTIDLTLESRSRLEMFAHTTLWGLRHTNRVARASLGWDLNDLRDDDDTQEYELFNIPAERSCWATIRRRDWRIAIDTFDVFARFSGLLSKEEPTTGFSEVNGWWYHPVPSSYQMVYHADWNHLRHDYLRIYAYHRCGMEPRDLRKVTEIEQLKNLVLSQEVSEEILNLDRHMGPSHLDLLRRLDRSQVVRILSMNPRELRTRLDRLSDLAPECSWFDFGSRGVAFMVPVSFTLANTYRVLAFPD